jgi:hypothetical protein
LNIIEGGLTFKKRILFVGQTGTLIEMFLDILKSILGDAYPALKCRLGPIHLSAGPYLGRNLDAMQRTESLDPYLCKGSESRWFNQCVMPRQVLPVGIRA